MKRVRTDDAGFTLPELLVAIVALGIITPAIAAAFATGVRTTSGTTERLSASNGAEFASTWFVPDVQSGESFSVTPAACFNHPAGQKYLFTVTSQAGTVVTGYGTTGDGTAARKLVRYACTNGTATSSVMVAHVVHPTVDPAVSCTPNPCGPTTTHVALTVTVDDGTPTNYTFNLNATRRVS